MRVSLPLAACALWLPNLVRSACDSPTTTISNSKGATSLASCTSFSGSVAIATGVSGDLALDGLEYIKGNLEAGNISSLTGLSSKSLRTIGQTFHLNNLTTLNTISFPALESAKTLRWRSLPNLGSVEFDRGINSEKVNIQDTFLQTLNISAADEIYIGNNPFAKNISIGLNNVTGSLVVEFNGRGNRASVLDLPELYWANNITIQNVASINMPLVNTINDTLRIQSSSIEKLEIPNLGSVKRSLAIVDNLNLSSIQMPGLLQVQELQITNNSKLENFTFDQLGVISGDVSISGNLTSVQMPVLQSANGTFDIAPANSSFNCDAFDAYKKNNVIKNDYRCNGTHSDPSATAFNSAIPSASSTSGGDNNNTPTNQPSDLALSTGGKAGIAVGAVAGVAALAGGALMLFLRRRKQQKAASLKSVDGAEKFEKAEKDGNAIGELHHNAVPYIEMPNGGEAQELPAGHGVSEVTEGRNVQGRNIHEIPGTHELQS